MKPYLKIDGYGKALEVLEHFQIEKTESLVLWLRLDGYSEAISESFEDAESYVVIIKDKLLESTSSMCELVRMDEKNLLFVTMLKGREVSELERNIMKKVKELPAYTFSAPCVARKRIHCESSIMLALEGLKGALANEWNRVLEKEAVLSSVLPVKDNIDLDAVSNCLQPIYWSSGRLRGFEVLARLQHPLYGLLEPNEFIPLIMQQAQGGDLFLRQLVEIESFVEQNTKARDLWFNLNGHIELLEQKEVQEKLDQIISKDINIEIEIDANKVGIDQIERIIKNKKPGIRFALNVIDFGLGNIIGSVDSFDSIKLSPAVVKKVMYGDSSNEKMIQGWIARFVAANKLTIANGVQSRRSVEQMVALEIDALQGFAIKTPMTIEDTQDWLSSAPDSLLHDASNNNIAKFER